MPNVARREQEAEEVAPLRDGPGVPRGSGIDERLIRHRGGGAGGRRPAGVRAVEGAEVPRRHGATTRAAISSPDTCPCRCRASACQDSGEERGVSPAERWTVSALGSRLRRARLCRSWPPYQAGPRGADGARGRVAWTGRCGRWALPADNAAEAALVPQMQVLPARHLCELVRHSRMLDRCSASGRAGRRQRRRRSRSPCPTMRDVVGRRGAGLERGNRGGGVANHPFTVLGRQDNAGRAASRATAAWSPPTSWRFGAIQSPLRVLVPSAGSWFPATFSSHHGASMAAVIGAGSGCTRPRAICRQHRSAWPFLGCGRRPAKVAGHDN